MLSSLHTGWSSSVQLNTMVASEGKTGTKHWYRQTIEEKRWLWRSGRFLVSIFLSLTLYSLFSTVVGNLHDLDKSFNSATKLPAMDRLEYLTMPDYGLSNKDIKYFHIDSVVSGRGPNRLRYLDLEGERSFLPPLPLTVVFRSMGTERKEHSVHLGRVQPLGENESGARCVSREHFELL